MASSLQTGATPHDRSNLGVFQNSCPAENLAEKHHKTIQRDQQYIEKYAGSRANSNKNRVEKALALVQVVH